MAGAPGRLRRHQLPEPAGPVRPSADHSAPAEGGSAAPRTRPGRAGAAVLALRGGR